MKSNIVIFWIIATYFVVIGIVYTVWNLIAISEVEWAGTTAVFLAGALAAFIAGYLTLGQSKEKWDLVEDREFSDIDDGDPELGEFSPWSWWPISLAFSIALVFLGLAIGFQFWLAFFAVPLVLVTVVGWVYEYYRGNFAR